MLVILAQGVAPCAGGCSRSAGAGHGHLRGCPVCGRMFLNETIKGSATRGLPRVRADVPLNAAASSAARRVAPCAGGCSPVGADRFAGEVGCPVCGRMFRLFDRILRRRGGLPRVRADVPNMPAQSQVAVVVAPCAGGCSSAVSTIRPTYSQPHPPPFPPPQPPPYPPPWAWTGIW